ncbi:CPBP family intramembrane glutamic endopeptidase [Caldicellulosiruptor naganoensis]|uniref:CPBP family intramembrane metalloprotease n=1 Tax=Caldicellulosiruptor naganoensis TaxID=29324 RepID=A0ABY7BGD6_9FIRM|nr:CPBP family intramembrane glutamic endopeptidase [Caldicellulosiruptor naganoensis]WAM31520.1 CPBP family intramembrane metalloprotease [Caldicellulosiruptor naganoensis]
MISNDRKIANRRLKNLIHIAVTVVYFIIVLIQIDFYQRFIESKIHKIFNVFDTTNPGKFLTNNISSLVSYLAQAVFFLLSIIVFVIITKGFIELKNAGKDFVDALNNKFFVLAFLEGIILSIILTYIAILIPFKGSFIMIKAYEYQTALLWTKASNYYIPYLMLNYLIVALMEEIIYRGIIYMGIARAINRPVATVFTSIIFAASHYYDSNGFGIIFIRNLVISLLLIYILVKTRSLWYSIGIHFGLNTFVFHILYPESSWKMALVVIITFIVYMILDCLIRTRFAEKGKKIVYHEMNT